MVVLFYPSHNNPSFFTFLLFKLDIFYYFIFVLLTQYLYDLFIDKCQI